LLLILVSCCYEVKEVKLTFVVNVVNYADALLVLGKRGSLEFYGPPAEYTGALETIVKTPDDTESSDTTPGDNKIIQAETSVVEILGNSEITSTDDVPDQRSEAGVWKYYLGKIGITRVVVAALITIAVGFLDNFESKPYTLIMSWMMLTRYQSFG
jgi:hypothetical protein